jgi:hypothetical protein
VPNWCHDGADALDQTWREIAAIVGQPGMAPSPLQVSLGDAEGRPWRSAGSHLSGIGIEGQKPIVRVPICNCAALTVKIPDVMVSGVLLQRRWWVRNAHRPEGF